MKVFRISVTLAFTLLLLINSAFTQTVNVKARLDTASMLIGDQVNLELICSQPHSVKVRWPLIPDTILGNIQVLKRYPIDTSYSADKKTLTLKQNILLTSFDSGFYSIPQIRFYYHQPPDTSKLFIETNPVFLNIHTVSVDTTQAIKPIKGPLKVPLTFKEILPWLILGLFVVFVIILVLYYLKKRKNAQPVFQFKPTIQLFPHEIAIADLEKLRMKKLWQNGKYKEYFSELTEIMRIYIESRYHVMALEMTSEEIIHSLRSRQDVPAGDLDALIPVLTLSDLVKFAKVLPLPAESDMSLETALVFVRNTAVKKDQSLINA
jgi:hypothetical protein